MSLGLQSDVRYDWFSFYYDALYAKLLDYAGDVSFVLSASRTYLNHDPTSVLDVGCGTGSHLARFAEHGLNVCGVDNSLVAVEAARLKLSSQGKLLLQDMTVLDTGVEIDLVVSMLTSLGYLLDGQELVSTLRRIRGVLPTGGALVLELWQKGVLQPGTTESITVPFFDHELTRNSVIMPSNPDSVRIRFEFIEHAGEKTIRPLVSEEHEIRVFDALTIEQTLADASFDVKMILSGGDFQRFRRTDRPARRDELRLIVVAC